MSRRRGYYTPPLPKQKPLAPPDPSATRAGRMIRRARVRMKLSQRRLANLLGCQHGLVSRWESGHAKPGRDRLVRLGGALGLSLREKMILQLHLNAEPTREYGE